MRHEAHNAVGARLGVEMGERAGGALLGNLQIEEGVEQRCVELERGRLVLKGARERERERRVNSRISAGKMGEEREKWIDRAKTHQLPHPANVRAYRAITPSCHTPERV